MADADAVRDADGFILKIPYICKHCGEGFDTRASRAGHIAAGHYGYPRTTKPIEHGTAKGARKHRKRGEEPCQPCKDAWAEYVREWRGRPAAPPKPKNYLPPSLERFRR